MVRRSRPWTVGALALAMGCGDGEGPDPPAVQVRDSAGVRIVHTAVSIDETHEFNVSESPALRIATHPTDPSALIHWIRGAQRLSDGRIAVISESTHNLRFFDQAGTLTEVVGREGGGPGEFRFPIELKRLPGDTLVVGEGRGSQRRSWFTGEGEFIRVERRDAGALRGEVPTGFVLRGAQLVPPNAILWQVGRGGMEGVLGRRKRDPRAYYLADENPSPKLLGWFGDWEIFALDQQWARFAFFYNNTYAAAGGDPTRIYVGDSADSEVRVFDLQGQLVRIIRDGASASPITERDIEWERWEVLDWGQQTGTLREWTRFADAMPIPDRKPAFQDLIVDSEGFLWLKEYSPYNPQPVEYRIYSPEGERVAHAQIPGRVKVYDVGPNYVLGLHTDLDYVESIVVFALSR